MKQGWHRIQVTAECDACGESDDPRPAELVHVVETTGWNPATGKVERFVMLEARCSRCAPRAAGQAGECRHHSDGRCPNIGHPA